jgi:hypothetical protein
VFSREAAYALLSHTYKHFKAVYKMFLLRVFVSLSFLQGFYFVNLERLIRYLSTWVFGEPLYNYVDKLSLKTPRKMPFLDIF